MTPEELIQNAARIRKESDELVRCENCGEKMKKYDQDDDENDENYVWLECPMCGNKRDL